MRSDKITLRGLTCGQTNEKKKTEQKGKKEAGRKHHTIKKKAGYYEQRIRQRDPDLSEPFGRQNQT